MSFPLLFALTVVFSLLLGILLAYTGPEGAVGVSIPAPSQLNGVTVVTCVFFVMWYMFLGNQVGVRFTEGLPDDVKESAANTANRTVANAMEQAIPFLMLMWLEALFVNPRTAQILGWIWVIARFFYPIFWGFYGHFTLLVEVSVSPSYIIISYFLLTVFFKCACGIDLHALITATSPWLMLLFLIGCGLCSFIAYLLLAKPTTMIIIAGAKKDKGFVEKDEEDGE